MKKEITLKRDTLLHLGYGYDFGLNFGFNSRLGYSYGFHISYSSPHTLLEERYFT